MIANCPTAARAPAGGGRGPAGCLMLYIATAGHSMASNVLGATVIVYVNAYDVLRVCLLCTVMASYVF